MVPEGRPKRGEVSRARGTCFLIKHTSTYESFLDIETTLQLTATSVVSLVLMVQHIFFGLTSSDGSLAKRNTVRRNDQFASSSAVGKWVTIIPHAELQII